MSSHKCRYCSHACLHDFNFSGEIESVLIYCEQKKKIKGNINRANKCKGYDENLMCVWTGEEYKENKRTINKSPVHWEQISFKEDSK